jgi:exosortase
MNPRRTFVFLCLTSVVLWWRTLAAAYSLALRNDAYTHTLLILPISLALILTEWGTRTIKPEPEFGVGSILLIPATLIGVLGFWLSPGAIPAGMQLTMGMLAVVTWWIGSFIGCFGRRNFRRFIFPLSFLLLLVPLPESALNYIVNFLQRGSAQAACLFFGLARVPVSQDGVLLSIPGLTVEVAKECSSIRSSLMLVVTSMVLAHLLLRSTWGKSLIIVTAIVIAIAKNGLRIFTLAMLGVYVDPAYLNGRLHRQGGIVFFLLSMVSLLVLLHVIGRAERRKTDRAAVRNMAQPLMVAKADTRWLKITVKGIDH